jgi:beta-glucosidase
MKRYLIVVFAFVLSTLGFAQAQGPAATVGSGNRVDSIVGKMTVEEKVDYIGGTGFAVRAMPKYGLPAFEMSDGPAGVRSNERFPSTTYAAGIGLAASWNPDLARRVGEGIGKDARARGINFMLGPGVNIYRMPLNGRNFEYFGEDPFLASTVAVGYIEGMQSQNVSATIKHFFGNNSEFDRHNIDSIIDARTAREIYLPVFEAAVRQAKVGAIMDSYNLVNGTHMTQNGYFNTDVVRKDWGFDGVMMSDWVATYDGVAAANNGLDLEMPTGAFMNRKNLLPAIQDGRVKIATIDEKVKRILSLGERFGWLDKNQPDLSLSKYNESNHQVALEAARQSMVLLKNEGGLLPVSKDKVKSVLVVGPDTYPAVPVAGGSGKSIPFSAVSVLEGVSKFLGPSVTVFYEPGIPTLDQLSLHTNFVTAPENGKRGVTLEVFDNPELSGKPVSTKTEARISNKGFSWEDLGNIDFSSIDWGELIAGKPTASSRRWTGYYVAAGSGPYELAAIGSGEGTGYRVYVDDKLVLDDWKPMKAIEDHATLQLTVGPHKIVAEDFKTSRFGGRFHLAIADQTKLVSEAAKAQAAKADAVIAAVGFNPENESEGGDRTFGLPIGQDELIRQLAAANKNTIMVVTSGGSVDVSPWLDKVPALVEMWYPGEQGGTALAEVLFGEVDPSGRLPITFEKRLEDNPSFASYYAQAGTNRVEYKDGVFVGYRGYEHNHVQPQFAFGYGLSYTTFDFGNLVINSVGDDSNPKFEVSFDVTNTGKRAGMEVAQVYVSDKHASVPRPPKELKGFAKVSLSPGETRRVTVPLNTRSLAYYDVNKKEWRADAGVFQVEVGKSSQQIELTGPLTLKQTAFAK